MDKVGRNDPCPCGSGKKYKKCCMENDARAFPDFSIPDELRTGTPYDNYIELQPLLAMWLQRELQFGDDRGDLKKKINKFERRFNPGEPDGIPDSIFMMWQFFELRYGKADRTLYDRMVADPMLQQLHEQGRNILVSMNRSYNAWYRLQHIEGDWLAFVELGTEREYHVSRMNEPDMSDLTLDELWYVRLVGTPEMSYCFSTPYILPSSDEAGIRRLLMHIQREFTEMSGIPRDDPAFTGAFYKDAVPFWAAFVTGDEELSHDLETVLRDDAPPVPELHNTDGDLVLLSALYFKVNDRDAVERALRRLTSMDYDEEQKVWQWSKKNRKKNGMGDRILLASIRFEGETLIAETNSEERAKRLCGRLLKSCGLALSYRRLDIRSMEDVREELRIKDTGERETVALSPQERAALDRHLTSYYLNTWINTEIPMLGDRRPVDVAETEEGRDRLRSVVNEFVRMERANDSGRTGRVDWDAVRRKLGI